MLGNTHRTFTSLVLNQGTDEGARFVLIVVAQSGSWCIGSW